MVKAQYNMNIEADIVSRFKKVCELNKDRPSDKLALWMSLYIEQYDRKFSKELKSTDRDLFYGECSKCGLLKRDQVDFFDNCKVCGEKVIK